jgi:hypothetical protein
LSLIDKNGNPIQESLTESVSHPKVEKQEEPKIQKVIAIFPYNATKKDELTFLQNDLIDVISQDYPGYSEIFNYFD